MIVVPAIDLLDGKAVRLEQGRYDRVTVYDDAPWDRARAFADACGLVAREFKEHEERDRGAIYYDFYAPGTLKDEA